MDKQQTPLPKQAKSFQKLAKRARLVNYIVDELRKTNVTDKFNQTIILRACEILENKIQKKHNIKDKFSLLIEAMTQVFGTMTSQDVEKIKNIVEFLLENDLVKKYPMFLHNVGQVALMIFRRVFL